MGYRDIESTLGEAKTATAGTAKDFPNGIVFGKDSNIGDQDSTYICITLTDKEPTATEDIAITIKGCDTATGTYETLVVHHWPQGAANRKAGSSFFAPIPWKHKAYVTASVSTETSTGVAFYGYLTYGADRS